LAPLLAGTKKISKRFCSHLSLFPRLQERRRQQAGTLSGGEQQMLAYHERSCYGQDYSCWMSHHLVWHAIGSRIVEILGTINTQERVSMLLVEQNASLALKLADHAYLLETGRMILSGTADVLRENESVRRHISVLDVRMFSRIKYRMPLSD